MSRPSKTARRLFPTNRRVTSTGPKTSAGKARSSRNAFQHGLSIPVRDNPGFDHEIERWAQAIAGKNALPAHLALARRIGEAQVDLNRVRKAKRAALENPIKRIKPLSAMKAVRACIDHLEGRANPDTQYFLCRLEGLDTNLQRVPLEEGYDIMLDELRRLDRYERRALRRRSEAVRVFELALEDALLQSDQATN